MVMTDKELLDMRVENAVLIRMQIREFERAIVREEILSELNEFEQENVQKVGESKEE